MNQKQKKKLIVAVIFVIIFLLIIVAILNLKKSNLPANNPTAGISPTGPGSFISPSPTIVLPEGLHGMHFDNNELYLSDQKEGSTVTISTVTFVIPGYVVIFKEEPVNTVGKVIGSSDLLSLTNKKVAFTLNEPMKVGDKLRAVLYMNTGEGHFISPDKNTPITNSGGNKLNVEFSVFPANVFPTDFPY